MAFSSIKDKRKQSLTLLTISLLKMLAENAFKILKRYIL